MLRSLLGRRRKSRHPAAIARREEAERARRVHQSKRREELLIARLRAERMTPLTQPIRPRDEIIADVRRNRISPASGGVEIEVMGSTTYQPEGRRGARLHPADTRPPVVGNRAGESPSAGNQGRTL